jgi:serine/threonine-protein kinase RsbW
MFSRDKARAGANAGTTPAVEIRLTLALPRDELSVPVVRRLLKQSLAVLGVERTVTDDIELALTEACTNVLDHAGESDEYDVSAGIDGDACVIEILDRGRGFDGDRHGLIEADTAAEEGRGIQLIRALVDDVRFASRDGSGTVVHLEKRLSFCDTAVISRLQDGELEDA